MSDRRFITSEKLEPVIAHHAAPHAIQAGNTLYISGQVARDISGKVCHQRDFIGQLDMVLNNIKNAVETASRSLHDLRVAEVKQLDVKVEDGKVVAYRAKVAVSFKIEVEI